MSRDYKPNRQGERIAIELPLFFSGKRTKSETYGQSFVEVFIVFEEHVGDVRSGRLHDAYGFAVDPCLKLAFEIVWKV